MPTSKKPPGPSSAKSRKHVPGTVLPFVVREVRASLSSAEWSVWTALFQHANRDGFCWIKNENIQAETGLAKNTVDRAKAELLVKGWLENCGQREGRGANIYRVLVGFPPDIRKAVDVLWDALRKEDWWNGLGTDEHGQDGEQIDWLIADRVIRALKKANAGESEASGGKKWTALLPVSPEQSRLASDYLVSTIRLAATLLNPSRGLWFLIGSGFEDAEKQIGQASPKLGRRHPQNGDT